MTELAQQMRQSGSKFRRPVRPKYRQGVASVNLDSADFPSFPILRVTVSPELSCRLIILKNFGYRAMLLPYEPCTALSQTRVS